MFILKQSFALQYHISRHLGITSLPYLFSSGSLRKSVLVLFCLFSSLLSSSQNLVPNPSFEDTLSCPLTGGQIYRAVGWINCGITPDYFNSCYSISPSGLGIPTNVAGNQIAKDGNAYAGFGLYVKVVPNAREFIGRSLSQTLIIGQDYFISFYISLADTFSLDCAINNIGVKFSTVAIDSSSPPVLNNYAHINTSSIISDKTNWIQISGWFTADSSYNYILIGNFFDDIHTDTFQCESEAYYYFDMVCVSTDPEDCTVGTQSGNNDQRRKKEVIVKPIPADQFLNISSIFDIEIIAIYSVKGELIYSSIYSKRNDIIIPLKDLPSGLYFLIVYANKNIFKEKFQIIRNF
ncbi:hypothetical protein BH11BAC1_BH11BAC1_15610 [soil metagenome]